MRVPKSLKALIGTKFDEKTLYEAAAWERIRLCRVFTQATEQGEDGIVHQTNRNLSHYYTSFARLNFDARPWYTKHLLDKETRVLLKDIERAQKRLRQDLPKNFDMTDEMAGRAIAKLMGFTEDEMNAQLAKLQNGLETALDKIRPKIESGRVYPWDHFKYKIKRIDLPEREQSRYRGPVLYYTSVKQGVITDMALKRR